MGGRHDIRSGSKWAWAIMLATSLWGCAMIDAPTPAERQTAHDIDMGRAVVRDQCLACHQVDGPTTDGAAPPLTEVARRYRNAHLDWELEAISNVGHYRMPPRPLSASEIRALAAYIQSLEHASLQQPVGRRDH